VNQRLQVDAGRQPSMNFLGDEANQRQVFGDQLLFRRIDLRGARSNALLTRLFVVLSSLRFPAFKRAAKEKLYVAFALILFALRTNCSATATKAWADGDAAACVHHRLRLRHGAQ